MVNTPNKVRCTVCNAVFDSDLDVCPVCGAKRDKFVPAEEAPAPKQAERPAAGKGRVRCLICGEILDAGTEVCPVCGAGKESLVPYDEEAPAFRRDTDERFLIIGGGAAAYNAAKAIRERNSTCAIVILAEEESPPYNRPMLTKTLLDDFDCDQIAICPRSWYEEQNITLLTGVAATAVDPENKRVTTDTGAVMAYDRLIYAAGARCFRPPIPGIDLDNVITLRCAKDAIRVEELLPGVKNAVVIGGGVLGIEAAWELHRAGASVTVIETAPRIMSRQLDDGAARMLSMIMEKKGIALRTGAAVCRIDGEGKARRVALKTGEEFPADLVIVSTGVVPNAEVLAAAGAEVNRAVVVDSHMRTSLKDIYAAGDCAVCGGVNFALWAQAVDMGRVAGANAAGEDIEYRGITGALTLNALDTSLYAVGEHGESGAYRAEEIRDDEKGFYEKRYYRGDRLTGFILIGDLSRLAEYNKAFEKGRAGI